jgi:hypothetical protein
MAQISDVTATECRAVMKYLLLKGNSVKKNYDVLVTLRNNYPSYSTVKNSAARFRTRYLSTKDEERSERPIQVTIPENVD